MKHSGKNSGMNHEGFQKRKMRMRDGEDWDPCGGAGVTSKQHTGYSGGMDVKTPKASSSPKKHHTSAKS